MLLRLCLGIAALSLASCDIDRPEENWGCCYYRCVGPRDIVFSDFFGSDDLCEEIGIIRCDEFFELEQESNPDIPIPDSFKELEASEFVSFPVEDDVNDNSSGFPQICETRDPPDGFNPRL